MRTFIISAVLCLLATSVAQGQAELPDTARAASDTGLLDPRLKVGARVRVRLSSLSPGDVEGRITEIRRDTLVIDRGGKEPLTVPVGELSRLSVGTEGATKPGLKMALGTLGFLGGSAGYFAFCSHNQATCKKDLEEARQDTSNVLSIPSLFMVSALGSALVGGIIGEALGIDPWQQVDKPLRVGIVPMRRGVMIVASISLGGRRRRS